MLSTTLIFFAVVLIGGLFSQRALSERMRRFYARSCAGRAWINRFPNTELDEIREFLSLFVRSFCLRGKNKLTFAPDDKVMDIYRTIYPQGGGADALECETLVSKCIKTYGVNIRDGFSDETTLGDLFRITHEKA